ncbi:hypothetical protein RCL1_005689 [Eukaryota sp. TZLM3-RCL]
MDNNLSHSLKYCSELPPATVVKLSLNDDASVQHHITKLINGVCTEHPFIAVSTKSLRCKKNQTFDLIQISSFTVTLVIEIHQSSRLTSCIRALLLDPNILKVFVFPSQHKTKLNEFFGLQITHFYDVDAMVTFLSRFCPNKSHKHVIFAKSLSSLGFTPLIFSNGKGILDRIWTAKCNKQQVGYAAYVTICTLTIYAFLKGIHPQQSTVPPKFQPWSCASPPSSDFTLLQKQCASFFRAVACLNPVTNLIIPPSLHQHGIEGKLLVGCCLYCGVHVHFTNLNDISQHDCFMKHVRIHMCSYCRRVEERNDVLYLLHLKSCPSYRGSCTTTSLLTCLQDVSKSKVLLWDMCEQFFNVILPSEIPQLDQLKALSGASFDILTAAQLIPVFDSLNENVRSRVLSLVYHFLPCLYNGTAIEAIKINSINLPSLHGVVVARRVFLFMIMFRSLLYTRFSSDDARPFIRGETFFRFRSALFSVITSNTFDFDVVKRKVEGVFARIPALLKKAAAERAAKQRKVVHQNKMRKIWEQSRNNRRSRSIRKAWKESRKKSKKKSKSKSSQKRNKPKQQTAAGNSVPPKPKTPSQPKAPAKPKAKQSGPPVIFRCNRKLIIVSTVSFLNILMVSSVHLFQIKMLLLKMVSRIFNSLLFVNIAIFIKLREISERIVQKRGNLHIKNL